MFALCFTITARWNDNLVAKNIIANLTNEKFAVEKFCEHTFFLEDSKKLCPKLCSNLWKSINVISYFEELNWRKRVSEYSGLIERVLVRENYVVIQQNSTW